MPDLYIIIIGNETFCYNAEQFGLIVFMIESIFCF